MTTDLPDEIESAHVEVDVAEPAHEVLLESGLELLPANTLPITGAGPARVIVVGGAVGSGKTTLISALYELFQKGKVGASSFAGSKTLVAFEQRCHLARLASGRREADTERTYTQEPTFLHLAVEREGRIEHLLMTDMAGEVFRLAKDLSSEAQKLTFMKRADRFVLLLDGDKLCAPVERQSAVLDVIGVLDGCISAGVLLDDVHLDIVFTKVDVLNASPSGMAFAEKAEAQIRERYKRPPEKLAFWRVAARPDADAIPYGFGVEDLFSAWMKQAIRFAPTLKEVVPEATRQIERFKASGEPEA